jgi:hypothetical protein
VQIHEHHIGLEIERAGDGLPPIDGLAHELETVDGRQQGGDACAEIDRVVSDHDPQELGHMQLVMAASVLGIRGETQAANVIVSSAPVFVGCERNVPRAFA